jgi:hypothetical protein
MTDINQSQKFQPPPAGERGARFARLESKVDALTNAVAGVNARIDHYHGAEISQLPPVQIASQVPAPAQSAPPVTHTQRIPVLPYSLPGAEAPAGQYPGQILAKLPGGMSVRVGKDGGIHIHRPAKDWVIKGGVGIAAAGLVLVVLLIAGIFKATTGGATTDEQNSSAPAVDSESGDAAGHGAAGRSADDPFSADLWTRFGEGEALDLLRDMQATDTRYSTPEWQERIQLLTGPPPEPAKETNQGD